MNTKENHPKHQGLPFVGKKTHQGKEDQGRLRAKGPNHTVAGNRCYNWLPCSEGDEDHEAEIHAEEEAAPMDEEEVAEGNNCHSSMAYLARSFCFLALFQYLSLHSNLKHGWFTLKFANHI